LRQQALGLLSRAQDIEGQSAEKSELLLQYEQKKTAIFDINQKVAAEALAQQKENTGEGEKQTKQYTGFRGLLDSVKDGFKGIGISIKGAGIGIVIGAIVAATRQAINEAQALRTEYEKIRKPLDEGRAALARWGDGIDFIKKTAKDTFSYLLGNIAQTSEMVGSFINRMRGISEVQEKIAEAGEREADYQEARAKRLKEEQFDREKILGLAKEVGEAQRKAAFDALNDEKQWSALVEKNIQLRLQINELQRTGHADTVKFQQLQKELIEQNTALRAKDLQLVKDTFAKQVEAINTIAPLAITHQEKLNILKAQESAYLTELQQLKEKGFKTDETSAKLQANAVQQVMLQRDYTEKLALDNDRVLEAVRLQYKEKTKGLSEIEAAVLRMYKEQTKERENQAKIEELILVKRQRGLTPEEQKSLDLLLKQEKSIEKQITLAQSNIDAAIKRKNEEDLTVTSLEKQVKALQDQGTSSDQIVATLIGRGAKEEDVLKVLEAQKKNLEDQQALVMSIKRIGTEYEQQTDIALEGVISRLKAQLDAIKQKNATLPVQDRDPFAAALEAEYRNALNVLSQRRAIRNFADARGEDAARFRYGDSLTDQALRSLQDEQTKTRVTIEQLLKSFQNSIAATPKVE
jgi:hypothetical protein